MYVCVCVHVHMHTCIFTSVSVYVDDGDGDCVADSRMIVQALDSHLDPGLEVYQFRGFGTVCLSASLSCVTKLRLP